MWPRLNVRHRHDHLCQARHPDLLLPVVIHETVRVAEAPAHQLPLIHYQPQSRAAADYRELAAIVLRQESDLIV